MAASHWLALGAAGVLAVTVLALYGVVGPAPTRPAWPVVPPRDAPVPLQPRAADGPFRILLVGTSLTARGDWAESVAAKLSACAPFGVEITRLARAGKGIRWGLPELRRYLAHTSVPRPDVVVAEFSGNDASPLQGLPLFLARERTRDLIAAVKDAGAVPFLSTMSPAWGTEWITRPGLARYHGAYRDIAAGTGAGLIDTAPLWLSLPDGMRRRLMPDGGHPTDEGMERIAVPAFVSALRPLVCG